MISRPSGFAIDPHGEYLALGGEIFPELRTDLGEAAIVALPAATLKFRGTLEKAGEGWQIVWSEAPEEKPGRKVSKKREPAPLQALGFSLDELKEARLASVVDFKGRKPRAQGE